jgi:outer membrane protein insertion porin family
VSPKITYHIPEVDGTERANKSGGFRGQSPDSSRGTGGMSLAPAPGLPVVVQDGPPLIAPPNALPSTAQLTQTYKIATAEPAPEGEESLDVHLYYDEATAAAAVAEGSHLAPRDEVPVAEQPATTTSPTNSIYSQPAAPAAGPVVHEVHRYPYDEPAPTAQQTAAGQWASAQPAVAQRAPAQAAIAQPAQSTYQRLVVRTQSPYQAVTPTTSTNPYSTLPVAGAAQPATATKYATQAYGGQTVGATGPESVAPGSNQYAVQQAAITEPYIPPQSQPTQAFGPPPMAAEQLPVPPGYAQPQPQQGYAPAPQGAPGPQPGYGPPGYYRAPLSPDPSITPVPPIPTNPQLLPSTPTDLLTPAYDPAADMNVDLSENQTGRIMLGVAVNSDAGLVGQILLDEQNFDWTRFPTSWDEVWSGKAWRGNGEHFRLEAAPGTEVQRYLASWVNPYFLDTPVSLNLSGSYFSRRYQDWDEQRSGGRVGLGYQWIENDVSMMLSYRGEDVKISNPSNPALPALAEVVGDNVLHGFKYTVANDTRDSAFLATEGHFLQLELEEVVGTFEYPRATFDARQYFLMNERPDHSGRHVVTLSTRLGFTGDDTPIFENFFAGGFSTMRGFEFRGASPVELGVQVGGRFEWLNTVEYLFPLTADDMIHGVAFCDFGTVEQNIELTRDNFRVAPGVGLRITVPAMGPAPIALDFAFPVMSADTDEKQVFSFNIGLQR